jgi:hypothetical protein
MLSGMKAFINLFHLLNDDGRREETVQCPLDRREIHPALGLEVSDLA